MKSCVFWKPKVIVCSKYNRKISGKIRRRYYGRYIYMKKGYRSREDYFQSLSKKYKIEFELVDLVAELCGPDEEFTGLVKTLELIA